MDTDNLECRWGRNSPQHSKKSVYAAYHALSAPAASLTKEEAAPPSPSTPAAPGAAPPAFPASCMRFLSAAGGGTSISVSSFLFQIRYLGAEEEGEGGAQ